MECTGLQRIVQRDRDQVGGRSLVPESGMAPLLADDHISEAFQRADQTISGYAALQLHAASTGINSSLT